MRREYHDPHVYQHEKRTQLESATLLLGRSHERVYEWVSACVYDRIVPYRLKRLNVFRKFHDAGT